MSNTLSLEQSAIREISSFFGNESALKQILSFTKKLKKEAKKDDSNVMTAADKKRILADIKEGLIEVELEKKGQIKSRPIAELLYEL